MQKHRLCADYGIGPGYSDAVSVSTFYTLELNDPGYSLMPLFRKEILAMAYFLHDSDV